MVSGGIGEDFGKDHLIFRGNGRNQSSPTEYIGRDYRKMTPIGGGGSLREDFKRITWFSGGTEGDQSSPTEYRWGTIEK